MTREFFFSKIYEQLSRKVPFVVYRKPEELVMKALLQKDTSYYKAIDFKETGFIFSPFDDQRESLLIPLANSDILELEDIFSIPPVP